MSFCLGLSPRVYEGREKSTIIIKESKDAHGVLYFDVAETVLSEESLDGSNIVVTMITVKRAGEITFGSRNSN